MDTFGQHLLVEYHECDAQILNSVEAVQGLMEAAASAAKATIVQSAFHRFSPQGVSGVVVIEESHLSVHTWPEANYAAVDFFTCGECLPEVGHRIIFEALGAKSFEKIMVHRGLNLADTSMKVVEHKKSPAQKPLVMMAKG